MKYLLLALALATLSLASTANVKPHRNTNLKSAYEWKYIDYLWESEVQKQEFVKTGKYDHKNLIPIDVDKAKDGRVFVTVVGVKGVAPATLNTVSDKVGPSGHLLAPYPDWSWYLKSDCQRITAVHRVAIDACNKLWVLDSGVVDGVQVCPAQLLTFDLDTDQMVGKLIIPEHIARDPETGKGLLVTPIVDNDGPLCANTTVYMADEEGSGLVVWNSVRLFRLKSEVFQPEEENANIKVGGSSFFAKKGISGAALSPRIFPHTTRFFTFRPLASRSLYSSDTRVIKRSTFGDKIKFYKGLDVLSSQTPAQAFSSEGTLFYGLTEEIAIGCWNRYNKMTPKYFEIVAVDKERLQYASGVKVIPKVVTKSPEELWVLTNKMQDVLNGLCDYDQVNFRILKSSITELITGTDCEMPDAAKQMLEEALDKEQMENGEDEATIWEVIDERRS